MSVWGRLRSYWKSPGTKPAPDPRLGAVLSGPAASRQPGWWGRDAVEQLRNYQSWVYAAVNAIAQEVARQRPFCFVNTGQAEHEQVPLAHSHPLMRLLDNPNPWMTPWELWYLTVLYLELTGTCSAIS
jgi:phage portal protein BeeE